MTRYAVFEQLAELTKLTKTERGYSKFIQKGEIEFFEYNRGYFDVSIYSFIDGRKQWKVLISFGTIDDGDYGGWLIVGTKEASEELVEKIAQDVFADMVALPTIEELNIMLRPYGMSVGYE